MGNKHRLVLALGLFGLTCSPSPTSVKTLTVNSLAFDVSQVRELTVFVRHPEENRSWNARFEKKSPTESIWNIVSAPDGKDLSDTLANAATIDRFLEALSSLDFSLKDSVPQPPSQKPSPDQASLSIRWSNWNADLETSQKQKPSEVWEFQLLPQIENPDSKLKSVRQAYLTYPHQKPSFGQVQTTSALELLESLTRFDQFRQMRLSTVAADTVAEIQVLKKDQTVFAAQRFSGRWLASESQKSSSKLPHLQKWIERLVRLEIKQFLDTDDENSQALSKAKNRPLYKILLRTPLGKQTLFYFSPISLNETNLKKNSLGKSFPKHPTEWLAWTSTRPSAAFKLGPLDSSIFEAP